MNSTARGSAGGGSAIGKSPPPSTALRLRNRLVTALLLAALRLVRSLNTFSNPQQTGMIPAHALQKTGHRHTPRSARCRERIGPPGCRDDPMPVRELYARRPPGRKGVLHQFLHGLVHTAPEGPSSPTISATVPDVDDVWQLCLGLTGSTWEEGPRLGAGHRSARATARRGPPLGAGHRSARAAGRRGPPLGACRGSARVAARGSALVRAHFPSKWSVLAPDDAIDPVNSARRRNR